MRIRGGKLPAYPQLTPATKVRRPRDLVGLDNLGNTCYMNSALQCMIATRLLAEYFGRHLHEKEINSRNPNGSGGILARRFAELIDNVRRCAGGSLNLSDLKATFSAYSPPFKGYDQHDAQEFLAVFLDGIHEDLNRSYENSRNLPAEPDIDRATLTESRPERLAADAWRRYLVGNKSFLVDLFQGQLESRVTCVECRDFLLKYEPFMYLSLPVRSGAIPNIDTLQLALEAFSAPELLEGRCWSCPKCKRKVPAEKRMRLIKLPPVFIIHFKRFEYTGRGFSKIRTRISAPLQDLNLKPIVSQKYEPIYDLYAVIDHTGQAECGHYTSACLHEGQWYRFDDTLVQPIEPDKVINESNYVLFYQRRDVPLEPALLRRQTLRHPENWPHTLRSDSVEEIRRYTFGNYSS